MNEQWTADVVGRMHLYKITSLELANQIGWNSKYLSQVLNGHEKPKMGEVKVNAALDELIREKEA